LSQNPATMRNYTNMALHGRLNFAQEVSDFPSDAARNDMVLINGVLWIYSLVGGLLTWFPLNNQKNTYVHTQGAANDVWTVNHGMGSQDFVLGLYDSSNNIMSPAGLTIVDNNSFQLTFTEAIVGRAVVIFSTSLFAPSVVTQDLTADTLSIGNGTVTADATGLFINGQPVVVLNSQGQADYGTL